MEPAAGSSKSVKARVRSHFGSNDFEGEKDKENGLDKMVNEMLDFLRKAHMNQYGPQDWYDAGGAKIEKNNGKPKCLGIRTVSTMCPVGKMFYKRTWRAGPRNPRRPHPADRAEGHEVPDEEQTARIHDPAL